MPALLQQRKRSSPHVSKFANVSGAHVHAVEHAGGLGRVADLAEAQDELLVHRRVEGPALVQARLQLLLGRLRHAILEQTLKKDMQRSGDVVTYSKDMVGVVWLCTPP